jgi:hypothetical protein
MFSDDSFAFEQLKAGRYFEIFEQEQGTDILQLPQLLKSPGKEDRHRPSMVWSTRTLEIRHGETVHTFG